MVGEDYVYPVFIHDINECLRKTNYAHYKTPPPLQQICATYSVDNGIVDGDVLNDDVINDDVINNDSATQSRKEPRRQLYNAEHTADNAAHHQTLIDHAPLFSPKCSRHRLQSFLPYSLPFIQCGLFGINYTV